MPAHWEPGLCSEKGRQTRVNQEASATFVTHLCVLIMNHEGSG